MKILYAVLGYKPAYRLGGPVLSVSAVAERLAARGHDVVVFTTNSNLDEDLDVVTDIPVDVNGVEVWYFRREEPLQRWFPRIPYLAKSAGFLYAPAMKEHLQKTVPKVDLVHTHLPFVYPTYAAGRAAIKHRKPFFYHQRGVFDPARLQFRGLKKRLYINAIEAPLMRQATTLIALTDAEVASYRALGISTHCEVIPNGIDIPGVSPEEKVASTKYGFTPDDFVILFMSRLHPTKGADKLIDAFLTIAKRHHKARLVMAGPDEWGLVKLIENRIAHTELGTRIIFPGMVSGEDKRALLCRANLFCLPSDAEGFSMAVLEALAHEVPVMLSPGCHFGEVEAIGAGIVVEAESTAMAARLDQLLSESDARMRLMEMGKRGMRFVADQYSWDSVADRMLAAYEEGIERNMRNRKKLHPG